MQDPMDNHPEEITFHEYLDDELSNSEKESFESHLSGCQKCQLALFKLEELFTKIEGITPIEYRSDISPFVVGEIKHIIRIEPFIKHTAWVQLGIISILISVLFSLVSIDIVQITLSNVFSVVMEHSRMSISIITQFFTSMTNYLPIIEIQFSPVWDLLVVDSLSTNLLVTILVISGLLWFAGNRILLPNSIISHSTNGG